MAHTTQSFGQSQETDRRRTPTEIMEKQFENDIEKAIALSLETQKLEDLKREKRLEQWKGGGGGGGARRPGSSNAPAAVSTVSPATAATAATATVSPAAAAATAADEPDLMLFSFKHVVEGYVERRDGEAAPPVPPRGFSGLGQFGPPGTMMGAAAAPAGQSTLAHRPSYPFQGAGVGAGVGSGQPVAARASFTRQSSVPFAGTAFSPQAAPSLDVTAAAAATAKSGSSQSQWVDPLLAETLSSAVPGRKAPQAQQRFGTLPLSAHSGLPRQRPSTMRAGHRDDSCLGRSSVPAAAAAYHPTARTSLDSHFADLASFAGRSAQGSAALSTSPSASSDRPSQLGLPLLRSAEASSMRRISSNPNFKTGAASFSSSSTNSSSASASSNSSTTSASASAASTSAAVSIQPRDGGWRTAQPEPGGVPLSGSLPSGAGVPQSRPGSVPAPASISASKRSSSLLDEDWMKQFTLDSAPPAAATGPSDLMAFSPPPAVKRDGPAPEEVFDFSEFDPLKPALPEPEPPAPEEPESAPVQPNVPQDHRESLSAKTAERKRSKSPLPTTPAGAQSDAKSDVVTRRPTSVVGGRPVSGADIAKPEPWRPSSTHTMSAAKKADASKVFFGDGLFDLATEKDEEAAAFSRTVARIRNGYKYEDSATNPGYIHSPVFINHCHADMETSVKVVLLQSGTNKPIIFTCDVNIYVQHVISQALCHEEVSDVSSKSYILKVPGYAEYLHNDIKLSSYEYVQECLKLDRDVKLVLLHRAEMKSNLKRTIEDDRSDISQINFLSLFERPVTTAVSKKGLDVLLNAFNTESDKLRTAAKTGAPLKAGPLIQTVKALCFTLAGVEPNEISDAVRDLQKTSDPKAALGRITAAALRLVDMYCAAFDTDFRPGSNGGEESGTAAAAAEPNPVQEVSVKGHSLRVCVASAHRLPTNMRNSHEFYTVSAQLFYGGNTLHFQTDTWPVRINSSFFDKLAWNQELELPVPVSQLPREARLILTLYGQDSSSRDVRSADKSTLGWVAISMFNFRGELQTGSHLLGLWADSSVNPIGTCSSNLLTQSSVILQINFEDTKQRTVFPNIKPLEDKVFDFRNLEPHNQYRIQEILEKDALCSLSSEDAMFLWSKRHYLHDNASALPRILEVAPNWDWASLADIYSLLRNWNPVKPVQTLQLLHPRFADKEVRCTAVRWMHSITDDELCDYLPQLVQALKYESYHDSALSRFLIERSIESIRVSHYLYWCLKDSLREQQYKQRIVMILGALLSVCSAGLRQQFRLQEALLENVNVVAEQVKAAKDTNRMPLLHGNLDTVAKRFQENVNMPTNPSLEIKGINVQNCGYYSSFTVPLKLVMHNADPLADNVTIMYKAGEDIRQDMLTMQMIRIMDKLWLSEGLDLRMITFRCMATGLNRGLVELVGESETMRKIQVEHGLTGSFKDKPLANWIQKHNPTELDFHKAVENFTYSCAGYCVATYVLGIGDRHNDNIMVARTGHMFHIDFGKFLGNAQMFGSIKRDRTPFVLTPEMAYVINGGEKQSSNFQNFVDLCSTAFNLVRHHADIFFNLFGLMLNAGIGQLSKPEDLNYVQNALNPKASDTEATAMITRLIEASLGSKATQINFFIHNLAHHSFSAANSLELSFAPKKYTMAMDGKIASATMYGIQKRYENEKYYVYIVNVLREGASVPSFIFRRYSEFSEFADKLAAIHPQARGFSLRSGPLVGRTHVKQVAEKRRNELDLFLRHLFALAPEISQCDLVYTFFHPSLRDEKDAHLAHRSVKLKNDAITPEVQETASTPGQISGRVKLAIHYQTDALMIMVRHAADLLALDKGEPDPYIKTYLLPDPHKQTKRKTRIQKKTSNPTYNEMLVYYLPWSEVLKRTIRLTAWDSDYLKENNFLGGIDIPVSSLDLSVETVAWYRLGNLNKET